VAIDQPEHFEIRLPDWCSALARELPEALANPLDRIRLAIDLSRRNVENNSGGPFGAVVAERSSGRLIAIGVNRVEPQRCSSAHAEIVALSLAQARLGTWNLAESGPLELATSCEPCAMCLGAIPWSGVRFVTCAATKHDAEVTGFDEGSRDPDWIARLARRGIEVETRLERESAAQVLHHYASGGARIYNP